MGLDISAYQKLTKCAKDYGDDYDAGYEAGAMYLTIIDSFANAADGYSGWYETSGEKSFGFRAGSYGGYNTWRAWLAQLVGNTAEKIWEKHEPGPFVELINFSDCEGTIGPKTSAKLAKDFAEWHDRAVLFGKKIGEDWFIDKYNQWAIAFNLAANDGVVTFH